MGDALSFHPDVSHLRAGALCPITGPQTLQSAHGGFQSGLTEYCGLSPSSVTGVTIGQPESVGLVNLRAWTPSSES